MYQAERRRLLSRSLTGTGALAGGGSAAALFGWLASPAAILNFVLGQYPVPVSFATTDGAPSPDDQIG